MSHSCCDDKDNRNSKDELAQDQPQCCENSDIKSTPVKQDDQCCGGDNCCG